jgi:AsmA protein
MVRTGPKRRLKWVALLMLGWLVVGLGLPLLSALLPVTTKTDLALQALSTTTHAADLAGGYLITVPVNLSQRPRIALERGTLHVVDAKGRLVSFDGAVAGKQPPSSASIAISNGQIRLSASALTSDLDAAIESGTGAFVHPILGQLARQSFTTLVLRNTTLLIALPDGGTEPVTEVTGELKRARGSWQFKGEGLLQGQRTALDVTVGAGGAVPVNARNSTAASAPVALKFNVKNTHLDWSFDGRLSLSTALQLTGATEVDLTVARQLTWLSRLLPESLGTTGVLTHNLKAKGALDWSAKSMALSNARLEIDGSEANGALSLDRRPARPVLAGTLAFQTLDLTRQLPAALTGGALKPVNAASSVTAQSAGHLTAMAATLLQSWGPSDLHVPLIAMMDADLRVSADRLVLGPVTLRRTAATVSNHAGKLLADVAAFEFDGGRGAGQVSGDFTGPKMRVGLRGRLDNLDAVRATTALFGTPFIEGRGFVTLDLTGVGRSLNDVVQQANGRITTGIPDGGRLLVDLRGLAAASEKRAIEGWSAGGRDQMAFDGLTAAFTLSNGVLKAEDKSQVSSREDIVKLSGTIDMPYSRLDITATGPFIGFSGHAPHVAPNVLQFSGPWSRPTVRLEAGQKAANINPTKGSPTP